MSSSSGLITIVAVQMVVLTICAYTVQYWFRRQPDKLWARYQLTRAALRIAWLFAAATIGWTIYFAIEKHTYFFGLTTALLLPVLLTVSQRKLERKLRRRELRH